MDRRCSQSHEQAAGSTGGRGFGVLAGGGRAAETSEGDTDGERLVTWLRQFHDYFTHKRALASELLEYADEDAPVFGTGYVRIRAAAESLADPARASGELRSDLT
ncbi:MAG: hypothetical protein ACRYG2_22290, partial [Janthinobacterium lividum]